ncbi:MAG: ferric iron uptake transcriptional regulator [Betaproteobacteria bacterium]
MTKSDNLKSMGLKATLPRLKILDLFQNTEIRHLSADDVYQMLLSENLDIGLATVYRALTQFEQAGLLERHHFESGKAVFEIKTNQHHDHLVCINCGKVEEFHDEEIERRQKKISKERGFTIQEHSLNLYAECHKEQCKHRQPQEKSPKQTNQAKKSSRPPT